MTRLLCRLFLKTSGSPADRQAYGRLSGIVGILCNLLLFAGKLTVGTLTGSIAITADAVNNLSDASSSLVTLLGFRLAAKPADEKHPYGHARIEYLTGLAVAAIILLIGAELAKSSFLKILHPEPVIFSWAAVGVLAASILLKLWLCLFNRTLGREIHSTALLATSADSRNDAISTTAVLIATCVGQLTAVPVDGYMGLLVACFILWSGIGIAKETISPLLGEGADEALFEQVKTEVCKCPLVLGLHDLMVHDYGPGQRFSSVHVEMDRNQDPLVCHDAIDEIERRVYRDLGIHLVIHYDPIVTDDPEALRLRELIDKNIRAIDSRLRIHDFRTVPGPTHTNLLFDVALPFALQDQEKQIQSRLEESLASEPHRYHLVITFDPVPIGHTKE